MKGTELIRKKAGETAKKLVETSASPRELAETLIRKVSVSPGNRIEIEWLIANSITEEEGAINEQAKLLCCSVLSCCLL